MIYDSCLDAYHVLQLTKTADNAISSTGLCGFCIAYSLGHILKSTSVNSISFA